MVWIGLALVVAGGLVAGRGVWAARRTRSTGAHGLVIAVGAALVFWGVVVHVVGLVRAT